MKSLFTKSAIEPHSLTNWQISAIFSAAKNSVLSPTKLNLLSNVYVSYFEWLQRYRQSFYQRHWEPCLAISRNVFWYGRMGNGYPQTDAVVQLLLSGKFWTARARKRGKIALFGFPTVKIYGWEGLEITIVLPLGIFRIHSRKAISIRV